MSNLGDEEYCLPCEGEDDDGELLEATLFLPPDQRPEDYVEMPCFTTSSMKEVQEIFWEGLQKLCDFLGLSLATALLVFRYYEWNVDDTTIERYMDEKESVDSKLKILDVVDTNDGSDSVLVWSERPMECPVCEDGVPAGRAVALARCRHFLCVDCLRTNLFYAFNKGDDLIDKRCPIGRCGSVVGLDVYKKLLSPEVYAQIERRILNEYIVSHKRMCRCPNKASCEGIICINGCGKTTPDVSCQVCGLEFCFSCFRPPHRPATCDMLKKWDVILSKNEPSLAVIEKTTKGCPNCSIRVEKNQGCNHMKCTQCQHEYCWVCLGPWSEHGASHYVCEKRCPKEMRKEGNLLLDCYERWQNHQQSLSLETKLFNKGSKYLQLLERCLKGKPGYKKTLELLLKTKNVLRECRTVLIHGYIALFFNEELRVAFRYRIGQLEVRTEELSRLIDTAPQVLHLDNIQSSATQAAHWCHI